MFTGIVQKSVPISFVEHTPTLSRYAVHLPHELLDDLKIGASVSINGCCQTVVAIKENNVYFEAIAETLRCTNIPTFKIDTLVNVEHSTKFGDEIGGHLLSGHIIGTATISHIVANNAGEHVLTLTCNTAWMKYILYKGYIALNGASLTVQTVDSKGHFTVHLIPETLRITTFNKAQIGDLVNIEVDSQTQAIVDTVERVLAARK